MIQQGGAPLRQMSDDVAEALYSIGAVARMQTIEEELDVRLVELIEDLATGELRWRDFADAVMRQGKTPQEAQAIRDRVYRELLVDILPKIDREAAPPQKPFAEVLHALAEAIGTLDERQVRRLREAAESFLRNARTEVQTTDVLTRSAKIGGVGLTEEQARATIAILTEQRGLVAFDEDISSPAPPPADALALTEHEEQMIGAGAESISRLSPVATAVDALIAATGARFTREAVEQRFRAAVAARFRDVRDEAETRAHLLRPFTRGGLGLSEETVRKLMLVIEHRFREFHHLPSPRKRSVAQAPRHVARALPMPVPTTPVVRKSLVPAVLPPPPPPQLTPRVEKIQVPEQDHAPTRPVVERQEQRVAQQPVVLQPKPPAPPPPSPRVERPLVTPKPPAPAARQKIMDVRPPRPRLIGPVEELAALTVEDFRKIKGDSMTVARRIGEKLDVLEKQSYAQRAVGLRALRGSPLLQAYADILNAALAEGKKVDDVLSTVGTLTKEEFVAIGMLSQQLRA